MDERLLSLFKNAAAAIGVALNTKELALFSSYYGLLRFWNKKINLFAPCSPEELVIKHFVDSLAPLNVCKIVGKAMLDIGSGAGFPALPIAIIAHSTQITLVESLRKKTSFLHQVVATLSLENVQIVKERVENHSPAAGYDIIVSRAAFPLTRLLEITPRLLAEKGTLLAMLGRIQSDKHKEHSELAARQGLSLASCFPYTLPFLEQQRNILLFVRNTP